MKILLLTIFASHLLIAGDFQANKEVTLKKLRTYCKACHGIEPLRFIKSEDDNELWNTLFNERSPKSKEIWAKKIIETLNWPSNDPPPFDVPMDEKGDWMPKGFKRLSFSEDTVDGKPTRQIVLETLQSGP